MTTRSIRLVIVYLGHPIKSSGYQRFNPGPCKAAYSPRLRRNRKRPIQRRYRDRWLVEAMFCRLKHFRRVATRYNKLARNYQSAVALAAAVAFWL